MIHDEDDHVHAGVRAYVDEWMKMIVMIYFHVCMRTYVRRAYASRCVKVRAWSLSSSSSSYRPLRHRHHLQSAHPFDGLGMRAAPNGIRSTC